jgi:hypothetical protein
LFGDQLLTGHLDTIRGAVEDLLQQQNLASQTAWQAEVTTALAGWGVVIPEANSDGIDLDRFGQRLRSYDSPEFLTRMTVSSSAGIGVMAGPLIWQAASRRAAASGRVAATRAGSRVAGRAGSAAAGGALVCAPAGPAALGCALLAGTAAWVGTDWLLLRFDEARNREALARWAPRLFSTLVGASRAGTRGLGGALPARLHQCERLQVGSRLRSNSASCVGAWCGWLGPRPSACPAAVTRPPGPLAAPQAATLWRRLFSGEAPRRGWDKFYPKGKARRPDAGAKGAKGAPALPARWLAGRSVPREIDGWQK